MLFEIIEHSFSALLVLSFIIFFELLIKFKRPLLLKILLMAIVFCVGFSCAGNIYCLHHAYNRWLIEFPKTFFLVFALYFYMLLHHHYLKRHILWIGIITISLQIIVYLIFSIGLNVNSGVNLVEGGDYRLVIVALRGIFSVYFIILMSNLYFKIIRKYNTQNIYFKQIKTWSVFGLASFYLMFPAKLLKTWAIIDMNTYLIITIITFLLILLFILYRPRFLNRTNLRITLSQAFSRKDQKHFSIDEFELHFFSHCYYLNGKASVEEFGKIINISPSLVSETVFQEYNTNFSDLVNKARIGYFVDLLSEGKHNNLTIEALAQLSGFGSRQSLYKNFKRFHGGSPSKLLDSTKG